MCVVLFFFFKQKTAYEMRISDWSSDVCSSDLWRDNLMSWEGLEEVVAIADTGSFVGAANLLSVSTSHVSRVVARLETRLDTKLFDRTTRDRKSVVEGKRVSVRLALGGSSIIKKKTEE